MCFPLLLGCTQPSVLDNYDLGLWCGKSLCDWETTEGTIRKVSTWDEHEYGVDLASTPSMITQEANLGALDGQCVDFTILGKVDPEARVELELDFSDDGVIDFTETVPGLDWQKIDLQAKLPEQPFRGLAVSLAKHGRGTSIFAQLSASDSSSCSGDPIVLEHLPLGGLCSGDSQCDSGHCVPGSSSTDDSTCAACAQNADCAAGQLCGLVPEVNGLAAHLTCVTLGSVQLGGLCSVDTECQSGFCVGQVCSECGTNSDCPPGEVCGDSAPDAGVLHSACVTPGTQSDKTSCRTGADCASGACCLVCMPTGQGCVFGGF
jgi:hypothetical protein